MRYQAVLFDMDGTVLDTLDDLYDSINHSLAEFSLPRVSREHVRQCLGNGAAYLVKHCVPADCGAALEAEVLAFYKPWYEEHCNDHTAPYAGIPELLRRMKGQGILTAVVSNKPDGAVEKLADDLFPGCFDYTAGEKDGIRRKPAPDMLEAALKYLNVAKEDAVYIGDSEVDLETAKNTGLPCISVLWGFRDRDFLVSHGATTFAEKAEDILPWKEHA